MPVPIATARSIGSCTTSRSSIPRSSGCSETSRTISSAASWPRCGSSVRCSSPGCHVPAPRCSWSSFTAPANSRATPIARCRSCSRRFCGTASAPARSRRRSHASAPTAMRCRSTSTVRRRSRRCCGSTASPMPCSTARRCVPSGRTISMRRSARPGASSPPNSSACGRRRATICRAARRPSNTPRDAPPVPGRCRATCRRTTRTWRVCRRSPPSSRTRPCCAAFENRPPTSPRCTRSTCAFSACTIATPSPSAT